MYIQNSHESTEKYARLEVTLNSKKIFKTIIKLGLLLVTISSLGQIYQYIFNQGNGNELISLIWLSAEKSIPTVYATFSLLLCSILLAIITKIKYSHRDRYRFHWKLLSFTFFYLAIDEGAAIHEIGDRVVRELLDTQGFWHHAWIIPAMLLLSLFVLIYFKFILALPKSIQLWFMVSGITFVLGAVGMEMISGKIFVTQNYSSNSAMYALIATIEEALEMSGIAIFIFALLKYIKRYISVLKVSI